MGGTYLTKKLFTKNHNRRGKQKVNTKEEEGGESGKTLKMEDITGK